MSGQNSFLTKYLHHTTALQFSQYTDPDSVQMISPDVVTGGEDKLTGPLPLTQVVPPTEEAVAMDGEYSLSYHTLQAIGKGAFGFVRLAQRKEDNHVVCTWVVVNKVWRLVGHYVH